MPLTKFKFNPGVYKEGTQYTDNNAWYDSDKMRFRGGKPEKIGGWERVSNDTFLGSCRGLHNWQNLAGTDYMGVGTNLKYDIRLGGSYHDITPRRATTSAGDITFAANPSSGDSIELNGVKLYFNDKLNLSIYLVAPIYNQLKDTNSTNPSAWFGIKYHKSINNSLELAQKRRLLESFIIDSRLNFKLKDFSSVDYYEKLNNSGLRDNYYKAINQNDKLVGNYTVLIPNYEIFESRNNGKITWLVITIIIALLGVIVMIHYPEINKIKKRKMKFNLAEEFSLLKEFTLPEKGTKVTYFLILINVLIFLSMTISGLGFIAFKGSDLILWGANDWFSVSHGDYWRLLTSVFLHAGIMHLGSNLAMLYLIGNFLESRMGSSLFLIAYIITGILASITSFFWHENVLSVGASGAIFGLLGVWLVLLIRNVFPQKLKYEQLKMVTIIIVINLLFGLSDRIDNAGHIGGLISGLILGFALLKEIKVKVKKQDMLKYKGTKK